MKTAEDIFLYLAGVFMGVSLGSSAWHQSKETLVLTLLGFICILINVIFYIIRTVKGNN